MKCLKVTKRVIVVFIFETFIYKVLNTSIILTQLEATCLKGFCEWFSYNLILYSYHYDDPCKILIGPSQWIYFLLGSVAYDAIHS